MRTRHSHYKRLNIQSLLVKRMIVSVGSSFLFDPSELSDEIVGRVPNGLRVRPLHIDDYDKGYGTGWIID